MKRCIIHFGTAKTGSTSIQVTMAGIGRRDGFAYVQSGDANAAKAIATAFMANPADFPPLKRLGATPETLETARARAQAALEQHFLSDADTYLLSTEMLSQFDKQTLRALHRWLKTHVDEVQLVGYLRPIRSYLESMFSQSFKNGNGSFNVAQRYPGFRDRLRKLEVVFGKENVHYRIFDPQYLPEACVVQDLAKFVGVTLLPGEAQRLNESLSKEAAGLLYAYRKLGPGYGVGPKAMQENVRLVRRLEALRGPRLKLAASLVDPLLRANADDLEWMESRLGRSLSVDAALPSDAVTVGAESDLLAFSGETLAWLAEQLRAPADLHARILAGGAQDVADAVDALRRLPAVREHKVNRPAATQPAVAAPGG